MQVQIFVAVTVKEEEKCRSAHSSPADCREPRGCGRIPRLCSLSITDSAGTPVEHLGLLACVSQEGALWGGQSGELKQLSLSPTQLTPPPHTKKTELQTDREKDGGQGVYSR